MQIKAAAGDAVLGRPPFAAAGKRGTYQPWEGDERPARSVLWLSRPAVSAFARFGSSRVALQRSPLLALGLPAPHRHDERQGGLEKVLYGQGLRFGHRHKSTFQDASGSVGIRGRRHLPGGRLGRAPGGLLGGQHVVNFACRPTVLARPRRAKSRGPMPAEPCSTASRRRGGGAAQEAVATEASGRWTEAGSGQNQQPTLSGDQGMGACPWRPTRLVVAAGN